MFSVLMALLPIDKIKSIVTGGISPLFILLIIAVSGGGYLYWQNHSLNNKVTNLQTINTQLELDKIGLTKSNALVNLELAAAYEKQQAVQVIISDLHTQVASIKSLNDEVEKDVAKYRKSATTKCVHSAEWVSIHNRLTDSINAASPILSSGSGPGVPSSPSTPAAGGRHQF